MKNDSHTTLVMDCCFGMFGIALAGMMYKAARNDGCEMGFQSLMFIGLEENMVVVGGGGGGFIFAFHFFSFILMAVFQMNTYVSRHSA